MKFPSVYSHSIILYDFVTYLGNLGYLRESIVTLAVLDYPNISLVHSIPSPFKMNSELLLLTVTTSSNVSRIMTWQGWRYSSTEHLCYLNTCRNHRTKSHYSVSLLPKIVTNTGWTHYNQIFLFGIPLSPSWPSIFYCYRLYSRRLDIPILFIFLFVVKIQSHIIT